MFDRLDHIDWASEAVRRYQEHSLTPDEHAIADLICDLGHPPARSPILGEGTTRSTTLESG